MSDTYKDDDKFLGLSHAMLEQKNRVVDFPVTIMQTMLAAQYKAAKDALTAKGKK